MGLVLFLDAYIAFQTPGMLAYTSMSKYLINICGPSTYKNESAVHAVHDTLFLSMQTVRDP